MRSASQFKSTNNNHATSLSSSSSSSSSSSRRSSPPLRILCLHDANSNADDLKNKLKKLGDRLWCNHHIDLVFVNAPIALDEQRRCWWQKTDEHEYLGLDASLLMIKQMWSSWSAFAGILGVGQGAAIGALLTLWLFEAQEEYACLEPQRAPPQMAIWIDGYTVLPEDAPLLSIQNLECFHILQPADENNFSSMMMILDTPAYAVDDHNTHEPTHSLTSKTRFVTQLGGRTHVRNVSEAWYSTDCLNLMGRYIVQQKQEHQSTAVARLQSALVTTEQEAAHLVARHAMEHPPSSLMAVIGPQEVSGWQGPKRNLPAGGAPCPADFLKPVHMRTVDGNEENNSQF